MAKIVVIDNRTEKTNIINVKAWPGLENSLHEGQPRYEIKGSPDEKGATVELSDGAKEWLDGYADSKKKVQDLQLKETTQETTQEVDLGGDSGSDSKGTVVTFETETKDGTKVVIQGPAETEGDAVKLFVEGAEVFENTDQEGEPTGILPDGDYEFEKGLMEVKEGKIVVFATNE